MSKKRTATTPVVWEHPYEGSGRRWITGPRSLPLTTLHRNELMPIQSMKKLRRAVFISRGRKKSRDHQFCLRASSLRPNRQIMRIIKILKVWMSVQEAHTPLHTQTHKYPTLQRPPINKLRMRSALEPRTLVTQPSTYQPRDAGAEASQYHASVSW